jgi:hypothetical protein
MRRAIDSRELMASSHLRSLEASGPPGGRRLTREGRRRPVDQSSGCSWIQGGSDWSLESLSSVVPRPLPALLRLWDAPATPSSSVW